MKKIVLALLFVLSLTSIVNAKGWVEQEGGWYYLDSSDEIVTESIQTGGNGAKFYLGEEGMMEKDYFLEDYDGQTYYFGPDGAMVTNMWVAIDSSLVDSDSDYVPSQYWYYFSANGKAVRGTSDKPKKMIVDGKTYLFNEKGQMCTGFVDENGKVINPDEGNPFATALYYAGDDNDGVLRSGWVEYLEGYEDGDDWLNDKHILFFYYDPHNNKKVSGTTKIINKKTYAFTNEGVMISGWDYADNNIEINGLGTDDDGRKVYFSDETDGHQAKNTWVFTVPGKNVDEKAHDDDEEKWFYFGSGGKREHDAIKKINSKYYAFDKKGIMQTGLVVWCSNGIELTEPLTIDGEQVENGDKFICKIDIDNATGEEIIKKGILRYGDGNNDFIKVNSDGYLLDSINNYDIGNPTNNKLKLHYFGDDGVRKTGSNSIEFSDDTYTFSSDNHGNTASGVTKKKYYTLGVLLKANPDIKYGIYTTDQGLMFRTIYADIYTQNICYRDGMSGSGIVLNTSGKKVEGSAKGKKDGDDNYWLIHEGDDSLVGIYNTEVKQATDYIKTASVSMDVLKNGANVEGEFADRGIYIWVDDGDNDPNNDKSYGLDPDNLSFASDGYFYDTYTQEWFDTHISDLYSNGRRDGFARSGLAHLTWLSVPDLDIRFNLKKDGDNYYFVSENKEKQFFFKTNDSKEEWKAFGMRDENGDTCITGFEMFDSPYVVEPTDNHFINITWGGMAPQM